MSVGNNKIVIGDGWAALGLVGFLAADQDTKVTWVSASGARVFSPLPTLEMSAPNVGADAWAHLFAALEIEREEYGEILAGSFLREFRNKAFREPAWSKAPTPEDRQEVLKEMIWSAERMMVPVFEGRFHRSLGELESMVREKLLNHPRVRRLEGVPVKGIQNGSVALANGETIEAAHIFYADRWKDMFGIEGMPKAIPFTRRRAPMGALQAVFTLTNPVNEGAREGFFGSLHKEAGEEAERHIWGYFSNDGLKSYWTLCLSSEEAEDNHAIAKKLRRMKNAVDKMFSLEKDFFSNVREEQVRFEEDYFYSEGDVPAERLALNELEGVSFLTDGYGPSASLKQVVTTLDALGLMPAKRADAEAESVNPADSQQA